MADIKNQFDPIIRKTITKQKQVAVIPVGSIEQHGPHLPVSTDSDIVTEVARKLKLQEKSLKKKDIFYYLLSIMEFHLSMHHFSI
jgi:creatinine amidohydrolase/Fe(II)-dependent formamide hydrolase-like protein